METNVCKNKDEKNAVKQDALKTKGSGSGSKGGKSGSKGK